MTPLDLSQLYDPRYDILPPRYLAGKAGYVRAAFLNGKQIVSIPIRMNGKLAYLIGVVIGDGYLSRPIKRRLHGGGHHWKLVITGTLDYILRLRKMFFQVFGLRGGVIQDKRKARSWQLRFASLMLHRFFSRVIELPTGRKTTHGAWSRLDLVREYPIHFLAGIIDSDGHIGKKYVGIIQKRFRFLVRIRRFVKATAGLNFHGPFVNNKKNGVTTSWIISIYRRADRERLLAAMSRLRL